VHQADDQRDRDPEERVPAEGGGAFYQRLIFAPASALAVARQRTVGLIASIDTLSL
jgi:hypothetical protein